jgi:Ca2+-binding RTX toxin-like protein
MATLRLFSATNMDPNNFSISPDFILTSVTSTTAQGRYVTGESVVMQGFFGDTSLFISSIGLFSPSGAPIILLSQLNLTVNSYDSPSTLGQKFSDSSIFSGSDTIFGSDSGDGLYSYAGSDVVHGGRGNDSIFSGPGNDTISGGDGNDFIFADTGSDYIDGGTGRDTILLSGNRSQYTITVRPGSVSANGPDGVDSLISIERIRFADGILAFDTSENAGQVYRLYQAAFARTPDAVGLGFWIGRADNGNSLKQAAASFIESAEFQNRYGAASSDSAFIQAIYQNVLSRSPDPSGNSFWQGQLNQGMSRTDVLVNFSESAENVSRVGAVVQNGIWFV